jgi:N-acetylglucosamine-6-phosphate deacetylase
MMNAEAAICGRHYATGRPVEVRRNEGRISGVQISRTAADNVWLAPALFDAQVNGFGGIDFQQSKLTSEELVTAVKALRQAGCARFLLTIITDKWPRMVKRLQELREARSQIQGLQAAIAGWHVEGPFLSEEPGYHGAHNAKLMRDPEPDMIRELREVTGDDPLMLTLSPERKGALEMIQFAVSLGIKVSLGHTNASSEILRDAVQAGATSFTHLGNGCPRELDRHDNILWRAFETPGLMIGLIPDRIHISAPLFRLMHRVLPPEAIYYVSDAMSAASMPPGKYWLGDTKLEVGEDQVVRQPGKELFAGSALRPIDGVHRAIEMLGCTWQEAWDRFSRAPARMMGLTTELALGHSDDVCSITTDEDGKKMLKAEVW